MLPPSLAERSGSVPDEDVEASKADVVWMCPPSPPASSPPPPPPHVPGAPRR